MEIKWDRVADFQKGELASLYFIAGEEETLLVEAYDIVKKRAMDAGHTEDTRFEIGKDDWSVVENDIAVESLFGERRFFDILLGSRGMDKKATDAIGRYLKSPASDAVVVVRGARFEWRQRRNKWFKNLEKHPDVVVFIGESLRSWELQKWIRQKSKQIGLSLTEDAVEQLAIMHEGNQGSANQELQQLSLIHSDREGPVTIQEISDLDSGVADTFEVLNHAFLGNAKQVERLLPLLRQDERRFFGFQGALTMRLRQAVELHHSQSIRVSQAQRETLTRFLGRTSIANIYRYLEESALIDSQEKGIHRGSGWSSLHALLLDIAGVRKSNLANESKYLRIDYVHNQ